MIDLFNPSIGDYVLRRYAGDVATLRLGIQSLRTIRSIITLRSLQADRHLSKVDVKSICEELLRNTAENDFDGVSVSYISALCDVYRSCGGFESKASALLSAAVLFVLNEGLEEATDDSFEVIEWGLNQGIVTPDQALDFVVGNVDTTGSASEMRAMSSLLTAIPEDTHGYEKGIELAKAHVVEVVSECFSDFIDVDSAFSQVEYGDHQSASNALERLIEKQLSDLGVSCYPEDIDRVLESYDVVDGLHSYYENSYDGSDRGAEGPTALAIDEIDDLFDRS